MPAAHHLDPRVFAPQHFIATEYWAAAQPPLAVSLLPPEIALLSRLRRKKSSAMKKNLKHQENDHNQPPASQEQKASPPTSNAPTPVEIAGKYTEGSYGPAGVERGITTSDHGSYTTADHNHHAGHAEPTVSIDTAAVATLRDEHSLTESTTTEPVGRYTEGEYGRTGSVDAALNFGSAPHYTQSSQPPEKRHRRARRHP